MAVAKKTSATTKTKVKTASVKAKESVKSKATASTKKTVAKPKVETKKTVSTRKTAVKATGNSKVTEKKTTGAKKAGNMGATRNARSKKVDAPDVVKKVATKPVAKKTTTTKPKTASKTSKVTPVSTKNVSSKDKPKVNQRTKFETRLQYNYVLRANGHVVCEKKGVNYLTWSSGPFEEAKYLPISDEEIEQLLVSITEARKVRKKLLGVDDKPKWG